MAANRLRSGRWGRTSDEIQRDAEYPQMVNVLPLFLTAGLETEMCLSNVAEGTVTYFMDNSERI